MHTTLKGELGRRESTTVAEPDDELSTDVDAALRLLRDAVAECGWNDEALGAHLSTVTKKKYDRPLVWRILNGHRPLSLGFLCALPDEIEALYEAKRAEHFGHLVVAPLEGTAAAKALVAGLMGVMGALPMHASRMARADPRKKSEVA